MEFATKKAILRFNKDFKPKSLTLFLKTYSRFGSEEELKPIYDKLNGNSITADKQPRKTKRKRNTKKDI